jgi:LacI family transcriptional regulator
MKYTIVDVSREAGVSPMTVSRTLHRPELVAPATRKKVLAVCERLNYRPNASARSLRTKRSHQVGVVIPDWRNPFWIDVVSGIEEVLTEEGLQPLIANTNEELEHLMPRVNTMLSRMVDGLLIAPTEGSASQIQDLQFSGKPVVIIDRLPKGISGLDSVVIDNEAGAYQATLHLLDQGHRRIGLLAGNVNLDTGQQRLDGYCRALQEHGLDKKNRWIRTADTNAALVGKQIGYSGALDFLSMDDSPTALLCTSNTIAIGALMALQELGTRIPEEMSIVSFGNMEWTSLLNPPLTVVTQPTLEMGRQAARVLISRLKGDADHLGKIRTVLEPKLIVRESSIKR